MIGGSMDKFSTSLRGNKHSLLARDLSESLGKLPPSAEDLEEAVLGAIMLEKNAMIEVAGFLRPEHFYSEQHREIFQSIQDLFASSDPIDMRSVVAKLRSNGKIELVGGAYYIAEITSKVSSAANLSYHSKIIVEQAMKRDLIKLGSSMCSDPYDDTNDVFSLIEKYNLELQAVLDNAITGKAEKSIKEIAFSVVKDQQSRQSGIRSGIDTGYVALDAILNGVAPTDLVILGARPSMGKSCNAVQIGKQIAERGEPVGIFSLEMSDIQLTERLITSEAEIDSDRVKKGVLDSYEFGRYTDAAGKISSLPIYIDDTPMLSIIEIRARAMRMKTKYGIKFIILDYVQLVRSGGNSGGGRNRDQEIGEITRTLKGIAKELEVPVLALSQLGRGVETRGGDKRPNLSDLRESGNIEQDADVVLFLYRPEYYKITSDDQGMPTHGLAEMIVAKHRNGSLDTAKLKFIGKYTKFVPWIMENYKPDYVRSQKSPLTPEREDLEHPFG